MGKAKSPINKCSLTMRDKNIQKEYVKYCRENTRKKYLFAIFVIVANALL